MEKNKIWEEDMEELINERMGQIYRNLINNDNFKEIRQRENIMEGRLEIFLKEKNGWDIYNEYEESKCEIVCELLKNYYKQGFKDAINVIRLNK